MSTQNEHAKSRNAMQAETRKAGIKVQTSVKAGNGIGTRTGGNGPAMFKPHH